MAASYLRRILEGVDVSLVESPVTPTVGVGEATIPFIRNFMNRLGYRDDRVWMRECDATFKTGILYENWYRKGDQYWHPFEYLDYFDAHRHTGHGWLYLHNQGHPSFRDERSFYLSFFPSTTLNALNNRAPWRDEYAYHFDAHLFADFLRRSSPTVHHYRDDVLSVELNEQQEIDGLITKNNGRLRADLYIDCTGFRSLLLKRVAPDLKWLSYEPYLFCDRAIALRPPYLNEEDRRTVMVPFVKASAQASGWIWTIPLYSRIGTGYVYSSSFISDDEAEAHLRRYWGEPRTTGIDSLRIRFKPGKYEHSWVQNCVAIGLSSGFIEPLESTGLAITQAGVEILTSMLDARYYDRKITDRYNDSLDKFYNDIVQFIIPHYSLTSRDDTEFWRAVKHHTIIPDDLRARLEIFRRFLPTAGTKGMSEVWMFRDISWFSVLLGMRFEFDPPELDDSMLGRVKDLLATKRKSIERLIGTLPVHYDYLQRDVYGG
jgi:tryptophan halogenase